MLLMNNHYIIILFNDIEVNIAIINHYCYNKETPRSYKILNGQN